MSVRLNPNDVNQSKERLLALLMEVQIELKALKASSSYDQNLRSDLQEIEFNLNSLMERIQNDS